MMRPMIVFFSLFLGGLCVVGCGSLEDPPQGIGYDMDALKQSACPCGDVFYQNGVRV